MELDLAALEPSLGAWLQLVRTYQRVERRLHSQLSPHGLTLPQFEALAFLFLEEGIPQQTLAQRLLVTQGNVCGLLDRLARNGLLERRPDPDDRRINRLYLTQEGRTLVTNVLPEHHALLRILMRPIAAPEQTRLRELLHQIDTGLEPDAETRLELDA